MTDWSNDPVFGDLALRLAAQEISGIQPKWGFGPFVDVSCLDEAFSDQDRAALRPLLRSMPPHEVLISGGRDALVERPASALLKACLLAATDNAAAVPERPRILGVVNVTPDSFSDGGAHFDPQRAIEHGLALVREGADFLDVGGESTRPGAEPVSETEELRRVFPVVCGLAERTNVPISIDTMKSNVAAECLAAGASIVNDVSAGRADPELLGVAARFGAGCIVMHMLGAPRDMQQAPRYANVTREVTEFLRGRCRAALEAGVERSKLWIDPGIGFGKTLDHNRTLITQLSELRSLGLPVVLGVSRKSFIAALEEREGAPRSQPHDRIGGTLAALTIGVQKGAEILRVHDVLAAKQAALVARDLAMWSRSACGA